MSVSISIMLFCSWYLRFIKWFLPFLWRLGRSRIHGPMWTLTPVFYFRWVQS